VPIPVRLIPNYLELSLYTYKASSLDELPLIRLRQSPMTHRQRLLKRAFDFTLATLAFIAVLPVFSIIALLIWLDDRGPIFYRQARYGENGRIFKMIKFRSMVVNAEKLVNEVISVDEDGNTIYKKSDDKRVTTIGQIIRKTSLDELPQIINIIRGDMSIVGPRPEVVSIVEKEYEPWQHERQTVPQGLTGWWQVTGRSKIECYKDTRKDIYYIRNYSFWFDIKIILMTIPALFKGKGAF
jgi:exopolysaccharide biosynthesis polyprenyl glycosylphosphotransferase